jgi:hypothetical protein
MFPVSADPRRKTSKWEKHDFRGCGKPFTQSNREGHDFTRAANTETRLGLQPLRHPPNPFFPQPKEIAPASNSPEYDVRPAKLSPPPPTAPVSSLQMATA